MIKRKAHQILLELARGFYVVAVTGPRQSGKTTLVRDVFSDKQYVSLEDPDERDFAEQDPRRFLQRFPQGAILDEVQRCPELFSYLQSRVDADRQSGQFILTGSQQFGLLKEITQSLAGRVGLVELLPFTLQELQEADCAPRTVDQLLFQGLYPPVYDRKLQPAIWYKSYVQTYVERDVRLITNIKDLSTFQRFIRMCAARVGQLLNLSNLANECGITHNTAKSWISILESSYLVFLLKPHYKNFNKRLVKTPKLYFHDTGLAAWLLNIHDEAQLSIHPARGPLFENWVVSEYLKKRFNQGQNSNLYFWRDNTGNEVDIIIDQGDKLIPIEVKSGQTLSRDSYKGLFKWLKLAGDDAGPPILIYGGDRGYDRAGITVMPWSNKTGNPIPVTA
ncbi:MAG TPA: ATP-binding protein [Desulfobacterales bacterium]|nr:ATP-binding protein [Desulfobacterales bacterium]